MLKRSSLGDVKMSPCNRDKSRETEKEIFGTCSNAYFQLGTDYIWEAAGVTAGLFWI